MQIQPEEGIIEEFLENEDFKYVRALGAFYLRLTGRPAEIYELIEPLHNDFRKLRFRESTGWKITYMDELADELLTSERYCGIALPHLPKRDVLVSAGYLDGPRRSALAPLIDEKAGGDAEKLLQRLADEGNAAAEAAMNERVRRKREAEEKETIIVKERERTNDVGGDISRYERREHETDGNFRGRDDDDRYDSKGYYGDDRAHRDDMHRSNRHHERSRDRLHDGIRLEEGERRQRSRHRSKDERRKEKKSSGDKKYGSLFKSSNRDDGRTKNESSGEMGNDANEYEGSEEYWNQQRAKLGLKPLKD
ncbi:hypothetical protein ACHAXR_001465 [Thalassiosira sp. AJA248-18]